MHGSFPWGGVGECPYLALGKLLLSLFAAPVKVSRARAYAPGVCV